MRSDEPDHHAAAMTGLHPMVDAAERRAFWKKLDRSVRWALVACELIELDDSGTPVFLCPERAVALAMSADAEAGSP